MKDKDKKMRDAMSDTYSKKGRTAKEIKAIFHAAVKKHGKGHGKERGFAQLHEED